MITKERLEQLIEQGAIIYSTHWEEEVDLSQKCKIIEKVCYDGKNRLVLIVYEDEIHKPSYLLENLTEDIEGAKWEEEFGYIERTERLTLPTWEEFSKWDKTVKFFNGKTYYSMYVFVKNKNTNNCRIMIYADNREQDWLVFEKPLTKENYTLACRKCKELFLGGYICQSE